MELGDIYFTLFRHKWRILLCSLAGFVAAAAVYKLRPPPYQSEAKLFIRYVITEGKPLTPGRDEAITKSPDQRGETIISSETEILTSLDLAETVVKNVGAEKILAKIDGGRDATMAAVVVRRGLTVEVPRSSSVIRVAFEHPDAEVVQIVLRELVASYLQKHVEIHRAVGIVGDFLTQETDQLRSRLAQTEEELRKATNKAGIISLEDYKKSTSDQTARLRQQIYDIQAELAERTSIFEQLTKSKPTTPPENVEPAAGAATPASAPPEQVEAYRQVVAKLATQRQREQEALAVFTEESPRVSDIRKQITELEQQKAKLEADYASLTQVRVSTPESPRAAQSDFNATNEAAKINALQARMKILNSQLDEIRAEASKVDQLEISIMELRRRKELEEANYRYYAASLEQSRINEALGTGRVSNISQIETPTPPAKDWSKTYKLIGGLMAGGVIVGLGWAFAFELYFDRSIRRPSHIERTLHLPLFLSIPRISGRSRKQVPPAAPAAALLPGPAADAPNPAPAEGSGMLPALHGTALTPFYETLRDRLISYFDSLNLRHKPKLIAVTGLGKDSGVTTIAAGLARSFSETGEGNVLLVDMTQGQGSAQHFHKGTPVGLDQLLSTRDSAFVQGNLYVVTESSSSERLAKGMPQRFNQLIPKLKASDFDYIIFDMPPVNQISITPRLASFMDMMLMVLEAEKTDRDIAAHASALLAKSKTPVGVVLNKTKSYVPTRLHQDREFLMGN